MVIFDAALIYARAPGSVIGWMIAAGCLIGGPGLIYTGLKGREEDVDEHLPLP
jgi:hypothetical protein